MSLRSAISRSCRRFFTRSLRWSASIPVSADILPAVESSPGLAIAGPSMTAASSDAPGESGLILRAEAFPLGGSPAETNVAGTPATTITSNARHGTARRWRKRNRRRSGHWLIRVSPYRPPCSRPRRSSSVSILDSTLHSTPENDRSVSGFRRKNVSIQPNSVSQGIGSQRNSVRRRAA